MGSHVLSGGAGLSKALGDIARRMKSGSVSVGFMNGAVYEETGVPIAAVAFWNEYGNPEQGRPPRPFFRNMIAKESPHWAERIAALAKKFDYDTPTVLGQIGDDIKGALKQSIRDFTTPALSPITIAIKGFDKPLIDTNNMRRAITVKVE